jgi:hypothetical protein
MTAMLLWYLSVFKLHGEVYQASPTKSLVSLPKHLTLYFENQPFVFKGQGFYFVIILNIIKSMSL